MPTHALIAVREEGGERSGRKGAAALLAVTAAVILVGAVAYGFIASPSSTSTSTTSTYYAISPGVIVSSAAQQNPSGYSLESSKGNPTSNGETQDGDWAVLGQADGSVANLTAVVFSSTTTSQSYFSRVVANLRGLPGYTDITPTLSAYQQYGKCYGYGEDVDGIAVVNGVCTKGNVLLQVHLVSSKAFGDLEADMTSLMGALYQSAG